MLMYSSENSTLEWMGSMVQVGSVSVPVTASPRWRHSVEADHTAGHLPAGQVPEALVDVGERVGPADQLVDLEPPVHVEVHQAREVDVRSHGAVHRAPDALLLQRHHVG